MNKELLLLIKKQTDTLIQQTRTRPQETLDFKKNKQMKTFSFSLPKKMVEEGKVLLAVTFFEATNSVFNITNENNSFSISTISHCNSEDGKEFNNKLNKLLEPKSDDDIELYLKEVEKRGTRREIENTGYNLAGFDQFKSEIFSELKRVKYRDLEDMVCRLQLTYDEIVDILDVKYIPGSPIGYTLPPGLYELTDVN